MSLRVCPVVDCPNLTKSGPCEKHRQTTSQRGYGTQHQRERARWAPLVESGAVDCRRCGTRIGAAEPWDLGHPDAACDAPKGPEHRRCNRATEAHAASL